MKTKPTHEEFAVFADHAVATLPDSLSQRKACLRCLLAGLPKGHPRAAEVARLLTHLEAHDQAQLEFRLNGGAK